MRVSKGDLVRSIKNFGVSEEGSAIVEFVVLGLPLFLPLFIFLTSLSQISSDQRIVQSLARQVARGFVTAPDEETARARVEVIKGVYQEKYFKTNRTDLSSISSRSIEISVNCSTNPCLTLNSKISVTAQLTSRDGQHKYVTTATEIVDSWRSTS